MEETLKNVGGNANDYFTEQGSRTMVSAASVNHSHPGLIVLKPKILYLLTGVTLYLRKGGSPNPSNGIPNRRDNLVFKHGARSLHSPLGEPL